MVSIIVAVAANHAIGKNNDLLWHISEDLKFFKRTTSGHPVVMGYNTYLSIGARPLPKRRNIVVSSSRPEGERDGVEFFKSLESALSAATEGGEEVFVMGGGMLYRSALPLADKLYITEVDTVIEDADTFFPVIDPAIWHESSRSERHHDEETGFDFSFVEYVR